MNSVLQRGSDVREQPEHASTLRDNFGTSLTRLGGIEESLEQTLSRLRPAKPAGVAKGIGAPSPVAYSLREYSDMIESAVGRIEGLASEILHSI